MIDLERLQTERVNELTRNIDSMSTLEAVKLINSEDKKVALAVEKELPNIARAVDVIYSQIKNGGRLIYVGCGTSGRLGVLDAVECPPTFGTDPELVQALIAGGSSAFVKAKEGAEDNRELGREDLQNIHFSAKDALVGIAASGRTPYVIGAMEYARSLGAPTISLSCCENSAVSQLADIAITPLPGPEVITGSTRLKSGTAQKMVLNMLSTTVMIKLGKVYGNLMVDVKATNEKLLERTVSIVRSATGADERVARATLQKCGYSAKTAIVMLLLRCGAEEAVQALDQADGRIVNVLPRK